MAQATLASLEKRVAALEEVVARLLPEPEPIQFKDWRKAVGKIHGTAFSKRVDRAGQRIRAADRRKPVS